MKIFNYEDRRILENKGYSEELYPQLFIAISYIMLSQQSTSLKM